MLDGGVAAEADGDASSVALGSALAESSADGSAEARGDAVVASEAVAVGTADSPSAEPDVKNATARTKSARAATSCVRVSIDIPLAWMRPGAYPAGACAHNVTICCCPMTRPDRFRCWWRWALGAGCWVLSADELSPPAAGGGARRGRGLSCRQLPLVAALRGVEGAHRPWRGPSGRLRSLVPVFGNKVDRCAAANLPKVAGSGMW